MPTKPISIELLYFDECPSWKNARDNLIKSLEKLGITTKVTFVRVETQAEATQNKFTGSPMIRVNGEDLFPTGQENYALGCRIFLTPEGSKGWPTEEMVIEKLQSMKIGD